MCLYNVTPKTSFFCYTHTIHTLGRSFVHKQKKNLNRNGEKSSFASHMSIILYNVYVLVHHFSTNINDGNQPSKSEHREDVNANKTFWASWLCLYLLHFFLFQPKITKYKVMDALTHLSLYVLH